MPQPARVMFPRINGVGELLMSDLIWCFLSPRGRLSRGQFVGAWFVLFAISLVTILAFHGAASSDPIHYTSAEELAAIRRQSALSQAKGPLLAVLLVLWPSIAISIKRAHDIGISAPLYLGGSMALIVLGILLGGVIGSSVSFLISLVLMAIRGEQGFNRYGPEPAGF